MKTIKLYVNKFTSTKIWYYIENLIVVGLFFYCIYSLTEYDNAYYQVWKNEQSAKAILAFTTIVFILRKVKLFNRQSFVGTLFMSIIWVERMHFWKESPDIWAVVKPQIFAEWLSLMIIIDMCLYRNVNKLFKGVNYLAILYILMTIGMIYRRNGRIDPLVLVFPFFLFALVKMDSERKCWFTCRFIDAWFAIFLYVIIRSFTDYPYSGGRYNGYFLNIGSFGIFMECSLVIALYSIYFSKERYSQLSFQFILSVIWFLSSLVMLWIITDRTAMLGLLFTLVCVYLFVRKDKSLNAIKRRLLCLAVFLGIIVLAIIVLIKILSSNSIEWLWKNLDGPFSSLSYIILRFQRMTLIDKSLPITQQVLSSFDVLTSGRISIIKNYAEYFNYDGNGTLGLEIEDLGGYWAFGVHNTYIQFLVEYGYISFFNLLIVIFIALKNFISDYIHNSQTKCALLPMLWITSMLGVWFGESHTFFYPITFFAVMFIANNIIQENK